jgi:hypothetical protein
MGEGKIELSPSGGVYEAGTMVIMTAIPAPGYIFASWSGDASGIDSTIKIIMNSDKNIVANFKKLIYKLTTSINPLNGGNINPASGSYDIGTVVTLTAIPATGYKFLSWAGDASGTSSSITITMNSNKTIVANFILVDTDGDGLTDEEERWLGTNPNLRDTDNDGLSDYEEAKVKKTNPLNPDTDGDGIKDGSDLFPLFDAYVRVAIKYFEETTPQPGDESGYCDPYFIIRVGNLIKKSKVFSNIRYLNNPFSDVFNVPDDVQFILVTVEVWDSDFWTADDQYDCSSNPSSAVYEKQFNLLGSPATETSDGAADRGLTGLQAKIIVEIGTVPKP